MNRHLYELLINGNYFTHSIGRISNINTLDKLENILKLKGLYSKSALRIMGYNVEGRVQGHIRITKDSYVSLFDPSGQNLERKMLSSRFSTFFPIREDDIIFLVDSSIELQNGAKRNDFDWHEIIVKGYVPFGYLFGILIPDKKEVLEKVRELLITYDVDLLVYDYSGNPIDIREKGR